MNACYIMGNLGADPDAQYNAYNFCICRFDVAVSRGINKTTGEKRKTDFVSCVAYGDTGDLCAKYLRKGSKVLVEGHIRSRGIFVEGSDVTYKVSEVVIENITFFADVKRYIRMAENALSKKFNRSIKITPEIAKNDNVEHGVDRVTIGAVAGDMEDIAAGVNPDNRKVAERDSSNTWVSKTLHSKLGMSEASEEAGETDGQQPDE